MRFIPKVKYDDPFNFSRPLLTSDETPIIAFKAVYQPATQVIFISAIHKENHGFSLFLTIFHEILHHIINLVSLSTLNTLIDYGRQTNPIPFSALTKPKEEGKE